jgi:hypothetical protein
VDGIVLSCVPLIGDFLLSCRCFISRRKHAMAEALGVGRAVDAKTALWRWRRCRASTCGRCVSPEEAHLHPGKLVKLLYGAMLSATAGFRRQATGKTGGLSLGSVFLFGHSPPVAWGQNIPGMEPGYQWAPDSFGLEYEDIYLKAKDGVSLHAWLVWPSSRRSPSSKKAAPVVLFFQVLK